MAERYRAIIIKDDKICLMERCKKGKHFYVFPGGKREENETEKECCERELLEEFGINVKAKKMIYKITQKGEEQGYFVCEWISGEIHKTDAEEYSQNDSSLYGTYNPTQLPLKDLEKTLIFPSEVKFQIIKDLKKYGNSINRPLIKFNCE